MTKHSIQDQKRKPSENEVQSETPGRKTRFVLGTKGRKMYLGSSASGPQRKDIPVHPVWRDIPQNTEPLWGEEGQVERSSPWQLNGKGDQVKGAHIPFFSCLFIYLSERERETTIGEGQREREKENPKQDPHGQGRALLRAWSLKPWDPDLSWNQESEA